MNNQLSFEGRSMFTVVNVDQEGFGSTLKDSNFANTAAQEEHSMEEERFYQKDDINSQGSISISFEKSFMTEHSAVLKWELKNYLEYVQRYLEETNKNYLECFPSKLAKNCSEIGFRDFFSALESQITP